MYHLYMHTIKEMLLERASYKLDIQDFLKVHSYTLSLVLMHRVMPTAVTYNITKLELQSFKAIVDESNNESI